MGEFYFKYIEKCKSSIKDNHSKIDTFYVRLNICKLNNLIYEYNLYYKDSLLNRIYCIGNQLYNHVSNSKIDTLLMIHSYLQNNLFDKSKVKTSSPFSGVFLFKKNKTYIIYCEFDYLNKRWTAYLYLCRGVIININSLHCYDINNDKKNEDFGCMTLLKKKIID